jgi:uncharacterized DUF497 family protein
VFGGTLDERRRIAGANGGGHGAMTTVHIGDFEWDARKAAANLAKHGVSFVEAMEAFEDLHAITAPDKENPERFVLIGMSRRLRLLFVVSAEGGERIRLISARKASPQQRKLYSHGT